MMPRSMRLDLMRSGIARGVGEAEPAKVPFALRVECRWTGPRENQNSLPVSRKAGQYERSPAR